MRGSEEVMRKDVYKALEKKGFDPAAIDGELDILERVQTIAAMMLVGSGALFILTLMFANLLSNPIGLLGIEAGGALLGAATLKITDGMISIHREDILNKDQVNEILEKAKKSIADEREELRFDHFILTQLWGLHEYSEEAQELVEDDIALGKLEKSIQPDVEMQDMASLPPKKEGEDIN